MTSVLACSDENMSTYFHLQIIVQRTEHHWNASVVSVISICFQYTHVPVLGCISFRHNNWFLKSYSTDQPLESITYAFSSFLLFTDTKCFM